MLPSDILLPYQKAVRDDRARFKAWCASRQVGKDFTGTEEMVADIHANGGDWLLVGPSERQSLESLEKAKKWTEAYNIAIESVLEDRDHPQALIKSSTITFPKTASSPGGRLIAVPGKPDTVRGFSASVGLTEFAFFEDPDATWRAILPSITNPLSPGGEKKARIWSTPNGKSGPGKRFYEIIRDNLLEPKAGRKMEWSCHLTTIYDAVANGLPVDIDQLREAIDDPEGWQQEFMCEFIDSSSVLLPYDLIQSCESFESENNASWLEDQFGQFVCGIDFGRVNDPTVCYTFQKLPGNLLLTREILVLQTMSLPDQLELIRPRVRKARRTCWDYTGPGVGGGDILVKEFGEHKPDNHTFGKVELCTFTLNLKRSIFPNLRRKFEAREIRIPADIELREDFHAVNQVITNGQYNYTAPRTAAGHSDRCTAAALGVRAGDDTAQPFVSSIVNQSRSLHIPNAQELATYSKQGTVTIPSHLTNNTRQRQGSAS